MKSQKGQTISLEEGATSETLITKSIMNNKILGYWKGLAVSTQILALGTGGYQLKLESEELITLSEREFEAWLNGQTNIAKYYKENF